jgi:glycerol-1-phosphate dehydrogenase [NAD(P)+]
MDARLTQASGRPGPASVDKIAELLAGTYRSRTTDVAHRVATRSLVIERTLAGAEAELLAPLGLGRRIAVVSDETTHAVLGQRVELSLTGRHSVSSLVLPGRPEADEATTEAIRQETSSADALIAVGSGTINDICKYASALDDKPYAVFATAPSMNGYTSLTAAITVAGHKMSLPARAPVGAFFDLSVLAAAPRRLIAAGLGDSICRTTAQADWLLAHLLLDRPFDELPFELLADDEPPLLDAADALVGGDLEAMEMLVRVLILSGLGTAIIGSSQPASQGEHLVSHFIDMFAEPSRPMVFHGEQVGVTTLSMARLQERMLEAPPVVIADAETEADFHERYGDALGASCWEEFSGKRIDDARADTLNARIVDRWPAIRDRIDAIRLRPERIQSLIAAVDGPTTPEAINLTRDFYKRALLRGREIRNRYTFLDLAANAGRLPELIPTL